MMALANRIPSGRAFSAMNIIYSKARKALGNELINKLTLIARKIRALRNLGYYELLEDYSRLKQHMSRICVMRKQADRVPATKQIW